MRVSLRPMFLAAIMIVFLALPVSPGLAEPSRKVLLVHSYHPEYPWVAEITRGVEQAFSGTDVQLKSMYMDTKRHTDDAWKISAGEKARAEIDSWQPEVVIAADDNAQIFVTQFYRDKKPFVVFCGVNGTLEEYGLPAANVTGILERPQIQASLDLLRRIVPYVHEVAVLSDDCTTSIGALEFIQSQQLPVRVLGYHLIGSFQTWQERIGEYGTQAQALIIYMYHTVKAGGSSVSMDPREVMAWTIEHCSLPTVGLFDFSIEDGILCGVVESGEEHGYEAGKMALALLDGTPIEALPVKTASKGTSMVNLRTAARLGLDIRPEVLSTIDRVIR